MLRSSLCLVRCRLAISEIPVIRAREHELYQSFQLVSDLHGRNLPENLKKGKPGMQDGNRYSPEGNFLRERIFLGRWNESPKVLSEKIAIYRSISLPPSCRLRRREQRREAKVLATFSHVHLPLTSTTLPERFPPNSDRIKAWSASLPGLQQRLTGQRETSNDTCDSATTNIQPCIRSFNKCFGKGFSPNRTTASIVDVAGAAASAVVIPSILVESSVAPDIRSTGV